MCTISETRFSDTIQQDKAAVLVYLRMRHNDPYRGYVLCGVVGAFSLYFDNLGPDYCSICPHSLGSFFFSEFLRSSNQIPFTEPLYIMYSSAVYLSRVPRRRFTMRPQLKKSLSLVRVHIICHLESVVFSSQLSNISLINLLQRWHDPSPMPPSPIPESMVLPASPAPSTSASTSSMRSSKSPRRSNSPRDHDPEQNGRTKTHATNGASSPCPNRSRSLSILSHGRTPSPSEHSPMSSALVSSGGRSTRVEVITFDPLSNKSFRSAFILNRFTVNATILYCSNDLLISTTDAIGRSFYDFVSEKDEDKVRSWIQCVKGWGVNEKGQPSDGGFGFGKFNLLSVGRDSVYDFPYLLQHRSCLTISTI